MTDQRPNPDELLARVQAEESGSRRGKLKIFFGYAAGVGKTYAMLEAAHREKAEGVNVVVGYVEPHGRKETERLLSGLESIPPREVPYRGVTLREFDLDAALARKPELILVDELAHTNAEGLRHAKRWQDVAELLDAGINVWTTLNVQHIESLNDVIAQIAGVVVRETLPDAVLESADEIELVDLTPEELMERLKAGKVYIAPQVERALSSFFQKSNLTALRELSLRQAAGRLQRDVEAERRLHAATAPWATAERVLVCIGASPTSAKVIRTAKRMAAALGAEWLAVVVDTAKQSQTSASAKQQITRHLRLAEQLGAEPVTLVGSNVADTVLEYARARNVTKIVVGKTAQPRWKRWLRSTVVDDLLEGSGEIDVYVITGQAEEPSRHEPAPNRSSVPWSHYLATAAIVGVCAVVSGLGTMVGLAEANQVMVFLIAVALVAAKFGRGPSIVAAIASVLVFDFFLVPPYLTFAVTDTQYLITFAVMLGIGLVISELTARLRGQLHASQQKEYRTAQLYRMTRQLSELAGTEFLIQTACRQLAEIFSGEVVLYLRESGDSLHLRFGENTSIAQNSVNPVVAQWVAQNERIAGLNTDTLPNATAIFVPMVGSRRTVGVLGVRPSDTDRFLDSEQRRLLETCASLVALSIERDQSLLEAHQAQLQVQTEQLRNSLLSAVSHDLRTPLAAIAGTASTLLEDSTKRNATLTDSLLHNLVNESMRLSRLVDNLLNMARLDAGLVKINRQWHVLEELVGVAVNRLRQELQQHAVHVDIPSDLPLLYVDGDLIEQLLVNLLENAIRYTPKGSRIDITATHPGNHAEIRVADNGPGLPPGSETKVFEKFFRGTTGSQDSRRGVGLGLAICEAIVRAHDGKITAANRAAGGAEFVITLPCKIKAPRVVTENVPAPTS